MWRFFGDKSCVDFVVNLIATLQCTGERLGGFLSCQPQHRVDQVLFLPWVNIQRFDSVAIGKDRMQLLPHFFHAG